MALVAKEIVTEPRSPKEVYPVYVEQAAYSHQSATQPSGYSPVHKNLRTVNALPLGVPVGLPETILRFSFLNNRLAVPAIGGPNHERAAMVVIMNLAYQIRAASGNISY